MSLTSVLPELHHIVQLQTAGQLLEAETLLTDLVAQYPNNGEVWHCLGTTQLLLVQPQKAVQSLLQAITHAPQQALYYYNLGLAFEATGNSFSATEAYRVTITLDANMLDAYLNWGNLFLAVSNFGEAEKLYREVLRLDRQHFGANWNLGNTLIQQQQLEAAIAAYETAALFDPGNPDFQATYAILRPLKDDPQAAAEFLADDLVNRSCDRDAIPYYEEAIALGNQSARLRFKLGSAFNNIDRFDRAIPLLESVIEASDPELSHYLKLIHVYGRAGLYAAAESCNQAAQLKFPHNLGLNVEHMRTMPVIYTDAAQIQTYRQRFGQGLQQLRQNLDFTQPQQVEQLFDAVSQSTNFLLTYQACNDRSLQAQYAALVTDTLKAKYPELFAVSPQFVESANGKIRVGILSDAIGSNQLGQYFGGWVKQLDRAVFEIYIYHTNHGMTDQTLDFWRNSDDFKHLSSESFEAIVHQVRADQLHILLLPEIGMKPLITLLSCVKLAPLQGSTWTHPITSGSPNMDFFLSSALMEPENADEHYSEQVIGLPGIGIYHAKPEVPELTAARSDFGLSDDRVVYLCCQSLFKYVPQDDWVWPAIARRLPSAQFVFISHPSDYATRDFSDRLKRCFAAYGLDSDNFCVFTPRLKEAEYMQLNLLSDIFLDSHRWSGGITTMKAVACDLPIVTCPGEFMRGRHSYAILKTLEVESTIAANLDEYVAIAVKLGQDPAYRQQVIASMRPQHDLLFNDQRCVEAIQDFFQSAVFDKMLEGQ